MIYETELDDYVEMSDEEISALNLSNENLFEIYMQKSVFAAKQTLLMDDMCQQKFGLKHIPDDQRVIYQKLADRLEVSDEEMQILEDAHISSKMEFLEIQREAEIEKAAMLGDKYEPILTFQDVTDGCAVN